MSTPPNGATRAAGSWRGIPDRPIGWVGVVAAVINVFALWPARQRNVLALIATLDVGAQPTGVNPRASSARMRAP
jgi:hypothetical protein